MYLSELWAVFFQYLTDLNKRGIMKGIIPQGRALHTAPSAHFRSRAAGYETLRFLTRSAMTVQARSRLLLRSSINDILQKEAEIGMAGETLMEITQEDREWARQLSEEKYILDRQNELVHAKREGLQEGFEKEQKVLAEERLRFLEMLNQGLSVEEIKQRLQVK